ncbi:MerR family transcriptional regulator [candidate division GN15 bacterium]|nr:MerR family transcriptional regulator [candidate division GN15 bacterium]
MAHKDSDFREKFHKLTHGEGFDTPDDPAAQWEPVISIGTAADLVGLSPSALRKYEREGLLIFHRTDSGRRLLCRADIKRINMIKHMINDLGLNVVGIRRLLALLPCWDLKLCSKKDRKRCGAVTEDAKPCWMIKQSRCRQVGLDCRQCEVYRYGAYCAVTMKMLVHGLDDRK